MQQKYARDLKEIDELFDRFRKGKNQPSYLIFSRDFQKVYNNKRTSYKPAPPMAIPLRATLTDERFGSIQIRYSEYPPEEAENGKKLWPSNKDKSIIGESLTILEKDKDYAWFIMYVSQFVKRGVLKLVDKDREFKGKFSDIQKQLAAQKCLFDESVTKERVEALVEIVLPEKMKIMGDTAEELATQLWDIITKGEQQNKSYNYDALIKANNQLSRVVAKTVANEKQSTENPAVILVEMRDGQSLTVPSVKCPHPTKQETLDARADENGLDITGLTRDEAYSVIKFKEKEAKVLND